MGLSLREEGALSPYSWNLQQKPACAGRGAGASLPAAPLWPASLSSCGPVKVQKLLRGATLLCTVVFSKPTALFPGLSITWYLSDKLQG